MLLSMQLRVAMCMCVCVSSQEDIAKKTITNRRVYHPVKIYQSLNYSVVVFLFFSFFSSLLIYTRRHFRTLDYTNKYNTLTRLRRQTTRFAQPDKSINHRLDLVIHDSKKVKIITRLQCSKQRFSLLAADTLK